LELTKSDASGSIGLLSFESPVLYVSAGTGIAPIRALIHERQAVRGLSGQGRDGDDSAITPSNEGTCVFDRDDVLVFGCCKEKADFYYRAEWEALGSMGRLGLLTAFSRDQRHKIYVQQVLRSADAGGNLIRHVLEKNGAVYIAGGPNMARAVKEEIVEAFTRTLGGNEKQSQQLLARMQRQGRFSVEAWA
jgi:sulfite reductase alpha subunit-like flavoprotein